MDQFKMLNKAIEIALKAHAGQVDKAGEPYIFHPLRVMLATKSDIERICGVLHDVIEDTDITFEDIRKEGFSEEVISILDCLTRRDEESYDKFIGRIIENEMACRVKLADLSDNMDLKRIKNPTDKDKQRIEKYKEATKRILDVLLINDKSEK